MTEPSENSTWRKCNFCRKEIPFSTEYYVCSVSTCNRKRTGLVFCSVSCCSGHSDSVRHRDGWAMAETSPSKEAFAREQATMSAEAARGEAGEGGAKADSASDASHSQLDLNSKPPTTETLVVVSKVKQYIRDRSGFNTSASTMDALTERIVQICDAAIRAADSQGRKTVMDRDVPILRLND